MAISKKLPSNEKIVAELINKGGSVPKATSQNIKNLQLRLPEALIQQIDHDRESYPYNIKQSRHHWIIEAILEKLDKKENGESIPKK